MVKKYAKIYLVVRVKKESEFQVVLVLHIIEATSEKIELDLTKQQAHHTSMRKGSLSLNPPLHLCRKQNSH
jgi:hypothetical protein